MLTKGRKFEPRQAIYRKNLQGRVSGAASTVFVSGEHQVGGPFSFCGPREVEDVFIRASGLAESINSAILDGSTGYEPGCPTRITCWSMVVGVLCDIYQRGTPVSLFQSVTKATILQVNEACEFLKPIEGDSQHLSGDIPEPRGRPISHRKERYWQS